MSQPSINLHGAVDLSALARPPQPAAPAGAAADEPIIVDVTEATFQQTVELSMRVPVVVEVSAEYAGGPSAVLAKVATDFGGRFQLARVDVETSPQIAQAFQVQAVPTVVAIVRGQPVPLYQGDYPEEQLRAVLEELLRVAGQAGVTGTVSGAGAEEEPAAREEPPLPPLHAEALEAIEREDYAAAADAYRRALKENPADHEATAALAQVELIIRTASAGGLQAVADAEGALSPTSPPTSRRPTRRSPRASRRPPSTGSSPSSGQRRARTARRRASASSSTSRSSAAPTRSWPRPAATWRAPSTEAAPTHPHSPYAREKRCPGRRAALSRIWGGGAGVSSPG